VCTERGSNFTQILRTSAKGLDDPSLSNFGHSVYVNNFPGDYLARYTYIHAYTHIHTYIYT